MKYVKIFKKPWVIILIITIISLLLRLWYLGKIQEKIFDEVYFVTFAQNYLNHISFFDIHPPLGKLIIGLGIKIFGDTPFGWRIMPAIFGTALIPLGYLIGKELISKLSGIFVALFFALDGMLLVYSRLGLIDIFLVFFILLTFYFFVKFSKTQKLIFLMLTGVSLGLAASVKYIGGLVFFTLILIGFVKHIPFKKYLWQYLICLALIPVLLYLSFFLFNFPANYEFFSKVIEWHSQSLNYNLTLKEGHPYGSRWWSWFLLLRPIWFYFKDINGKYIGVDGMGNPLAWWSSIIIIPLLIWQVYKKEKTAVIILGSFLIFLIPWAFFKRVLFIYHAIPSFTFLSLGIAYNLEKLLKISYGKFYVTLYFVLMALLFGYFLPIWVGWPITQPIFYHRMWLKSWI